MTIITVKTGGIAADAVTDAKIADDVVGTEHLTANEVDTAALKADAVTGAQLADNAVNSEHYTDGSIDTAHIADAQITAAKLASGVGGITVADVFRLTAAKNDNSVISANLEEADDASFGRIGTAMSQSSGVFTFPSTGIYQVMVNATVRSISDNNSLITIQVTRNNGTAYDDVSYLNAGNATDAIVTPTVCGLAFVDVTDVGQIKVRFSTTSLATTNCFISGNTNYNETSFTFIRLGDT